MLLFCAHWSDASRVAPVLTKLNALSSKKPGESNRWEKDKKKLSDIAAKKGLQRHVFVLPKRRRLPNHVYWPGVYESSDDIHFH